MATTKEIDEHNDDSEPINDWVQDTIEKSETLRLLRFGKTIVMTGVALGIIGWAIGSSLFRGRK
jgi:hypothetical protein